MSAKRLSVAVATTLLVTAGAGAARAEPSRDLPEGGGYYAYADVVDVTPRYGWHEVSEPVVQCVEPAPSARYGHRDDYRVHRHDYRNHHDDRRDHSGSGEGAAGLVGGLIGGLIGHQFGGGNGKTALTIAGAALGASVARGYVRERRDVDRYRREWQGSEWRERYEPVGQCAQTYRTRRVRGVNGYDVTYRYQGATFHKWVNEHPGDVIRVRVDVEPVADGSAVAFRMDSSSRR